MEAAEAIEEEEEEEEEEAEEAEEVAGAKGAKGSLCGFGEKPWGKKARLLNETINQLQPKHWSSIQKHANVYLQKSTGCSTNEGISEDEDEDSRYPHARLIIDWYDSFKQRCKNRNSHGLQNNGPIMRGHGNFSRSMTSVLDVHSLQVDRMIDRFDLFVHLLIASTVLRVQCVSACERWLAVMCQGLFFEDYIHLKTSSIRQNISRMVCYL